MFFQNEPHGNKNDIIGWQWLFFAVNVNFRYPFMYLCENWSQSAPLVANISYQYELIYAMFSFGIISNVRSSKNLYTQSRIVMI